jgi:hypothetical protein
MQWLSANRRGRGRATTRRETPEVSSNNGKFPKLIAYQGNPLATSAGLGATATVPKDSRSLAVK